VYGQPDERKSGWSSVASVAKAEASQSWEAEATQRERQEGRKRVERRGGSGREMKL
jgi:hypothetical protein